MNRFKRNGITKIAVVALCVAAASFTFTGVVQSSASGVPLMLDAAKSHLQTAGSISAMLTIPFLPVADTDYDKSDKQEGGGTPENSVPPQATDTTVSQQHQQPSETEISSTDETSIPENNSTSETDTVDVDVFVPPVSNLISCNVNNIGNDLLGFTADDGIIEKETFLPLTGPAIIDLSHGQINNCTNLSSGEVIKIINEVPDIKIETGTMPQVLIIHTHTTESYSTGDGKYYDKNYSGRSLCPANSVVGVGAIIASRLSEKGICTVHDGTIFDDPVYSDSYSRSRTRIQEILKLYPSIKVVLDIHRDGIQYDDVRIAPVAEINGKEAAQIMIICGADDGSGMLPRYKENLKFASFIQTSIEKDNSGITRPVLFDYRYYNQDLTTGSLLIEVGALGNTKAQADYSAQLIGDSIADALLKLS